MTTGKLRLCLAILSVAALGYAYREVSSSTLMAQTAGSFLDSLSAEQRSGAVFSMDDKERDFWHFIPSADILKQSGHPRPGLMLADMNTSQRQLAGALLSAGLSREGNIKAQTIMSLEAVLREMENDSGARRNPEKYHFSVFGTPSASGIWGYRIEGHHLSLHYTLANGEIAASPTFFGSNPAEVREGPRKGLRALANEEDLAREFLASLTPRQLEQAIVSETAPRDILTSASRQAVIEGQPDGLGWKQMDRSQRSKIEAIVLEYAHNMPPEIALHRMKLFQDAGSEIHFAWAGSTERGEAHYYRIRTPKFLIEYDCTQNRANHIHAVWREFGGDFGRDLLALHYQRDHQ